MSASRLPGSIEPGVTAGPGAALAGTLPSSRAEFTGAAGSRELRPVEAAPSGPASGGPASLSGGVSGAASSGISGVVSSVVSGALRALVVEPCKAHANALGAALQRAGFSVAHAGSAEEVAESALRGAGFHLILSELKLPGQSGLGLLRRVRQACPATAFFVLTGQPDVASSVSALSLGATEYLTKPLDEARLVALCRAAVARTASDGRGGRLDADAVPAPPTRDECADLVAQSPAMRGLLLRLPGLSQSAAPVLVHGEPGAGKRLVAQVVHRLSACASGPLVVVRPEELGPDRLARVLWGQAASGSMAEQLGAVQQASGGSLLITEVERLSAPDRWLLARLITRGIYRPMGVTAERAVAVRVLLTTSQPMALLLGDSEADLLPGLRCVELRVPPLRERAEDLPALAARLLLEIAAQRDTPPLVLTADSARLLLDHRWPGNGSELRAALLAAAQRATGPQLGTEPRPDALAIDLQVGLPAGSPAGLRTRLKIGLDAGLQAARPRRPALPNQAGRLWWRGLRHVVAQLPMAYRGRRHPWGPIGTLARVLGERRRQQQAEARGDGR